jgi:DNA-binding transcriptional MerR regulator
MKWAFNITKDEPVLALDVDLVAEDRFVCSECSLPATYVNLKEGHFRHPLGIKDTSWECSLLSERTEHKNSTKNYKSISTLVAKGTLSPEEAQQALIHTLKNRDTSLKEYQGLLVTETSLRNKLKRENEELVSSLRKENEELVSENASLSSVPPRDWSIPEWMTFRHPSFLGNPIFKAEWLDEHTHSKVIQLCKVPASSMNRSGGDSVYGKIMLSELEKSCQRIMGWIANPQTDNAGMSLRHVSSVLKKELNPPETARQIADAITRDKRDRRDSVEEFLKIVVNKLFETNTDLIRKYN